MRDYAIETSLKMKIDITGVQDYPLWIDSYSDAEIKVNDEIYTAPFALIGSRVIPVHKAFADLTLDDFYLDGKDKPPEIILLGTGKRPQFLSPELQVALYQAGVHPDTMLTASACRTFNLLKADGRDVWAWFWFD